MISGYDYDYDYDYIICMYGHTIDRMDGYECGGGKAPGVVVGQRLVEGGCVVELSLWHRTRAYQGEKFASFYSPTAIN